MDRGAWGVTVHGSTESDTTERLSTHAPLAWGLGFLFSLASIIFIYFLKTVYIYSNAYNVQYITFKMNIRNLYKN